MKSNLSAVARAATKKYTASTQEVGKNLKVSVTEDGIMTIIIDLTKTQGPSATGKTTIIGTSSGNVQIAGSDDTVIGVNVYKKKT